MVQSMILMEESFKDQLSKIYLILTAQFTKAILFALRRKNSQENLHKLIGLHDR